MAFGEGKGVDKRGRPWWVWRLLHASKKLGFFSL